MGQSMMVRSFMVPGTWCLAVGLVMLIALDSPGWAGPFDAVSSEAPAAAPTASVAQASAPAPNPEIDEEFKGHHRGRAKTEYVMAGDALAPVEKFDDLQALRTFLLPQADPIMRQRYPSLSKADTDESRRVAEEHHNVSVIAYVYAVKHETGKTGDNDFHVILGSSPTPSATTIYLTAEASGLPHHGPTKKLIAHSRDQLLSIIGDCRCNARFRRQSPPIRVRVTGSLFFDGEHPTGSEGPKYARTFTAWEIHPILTIERLDNP
jgi:hypothetical protein